MGAGSAAGAGLYVGRLGGWRQEIVADGVRIEKRREGGSGLLVWVAGRSGVMMVVLGVMIIIMMMVLMGLGS